MMFMMTNYNFTFFSSKLFLLFVCSVPGPQNQQIFAKRLAREFKGPSQTEHTNNKHVSDVSEHRLFEVKIVLL